MQRIIEIIKEGDGNKNNVVTREKAIVLLKNISNHPETKLPMYNFPMLTKSLIEVIEQENPVSRKPNYVSGPSNPITHDPLPRHS